MNQFPLFSLPRLTGKFLNNVLESKWLTSGSMGRRLQEATSAFLNVRSEQVVLASSATAGFQAIIDMLNEDNEQLGVVEITDATWPGLLQIADRYGIRGVCGDWRWGIKVKTDIGGSRLSEYDEANPDVWPGAVYVHDCCHSWLPDREADFSLVSWYPTKLAPGAEGGAVICKNPEHAERLRRLLYCALVPGSASRTPQGWGRKANMTDVTAALNLEALELASRYIEEIGAAWDVLADTACDLGVPYREQPIRPYLFQVKVNPAEWQAKLPYPTAWNFAPAHLLTVPCWPGLDPATARQILLPFAP